MGTDISLLSEFSSEFEPRQMIGHAEFVQAVSEAEIGLGFSWCTPEFPFGVVEVWLT